jgi:hypothetical protein
MIASAMEIEVERPEMPEEDGAHDAGRDVLAEAARYAIDVYRDEWLHQPAVDALYPGRRWSALD